MSQPGPLVSVSEARRLLLGTFRWTGGHADFSGVFGHAGLLDVAGEALAAPFVDSGVSAVVGLEARGFAVGALVARHLGVGLVLARKPGSVHPDAENEIAAAPDWRGRHIEVRISRRAVAPGDRLLLVDDWIETGSQARTVARLVERLGGTLVGVAVLVDGTSAEVRRELSVVGLTRIDELPIDPVSTAG
jgi:adenine phosphoribosyltransferase